MFHVKTALGYFVASSSCSARPMPDANSVMHKIGGQSRKISTRIYYKILETSENQKKKKKQFETDSRGRNLCCLAFQSMHKTRKPVRAHQRHMHARLSIANAVA